MARKIFLCLPLAFLLMAVGSAFPQSHPARARDLGIPFEGTPGRFNSITDVKGVTVGFTTLITGSGKLVVGKGPVRTGVTAILPRGMRAKDPVMAGFFSQNGNGEMTGTTWVEESGFLEGPGMITNTHSVGVVRDAILQWQVARPGLQPWGLPVVAETYDGFLNDINGFHVKPEHVLSALDDDEPQVLVSDIRMPGGSGIDLLTKVKARHPGLPVIVTDAGGPSENMLPDETGKKSASYGPQVNAGLMTAHGARPCFLPGIIADHRHGGGIIESLAQAFGRHEGE